MKSWRWYIKSLKELNGFEKAVYEDKQDKLRKEFEKYVIELE